MTNSHIETTKIFMDGRSQAVRLPKAFRFDTETVIIKRFGEGVLLLPMTASWQTLEAALAEFDDTLPLTREPQEVQPREEMF